MSYDYEMVEYQRQIVAGSQRVAMSLLGRDVDVNAVSDHLGRWFAVQFRAEVYGRGIKRVTRTRTEHVPATWWDAFKVETRIGRWIGRRRPANLRAINLHVDVAVSELLPKQAVARGFGVLSMAVQTEY